MTELEMRVWNYSVALRIAKDEGRTDAVEILIPLHRAAVTDLMAEWDRQAEVDEAA